MKEKKKDGMFKIGNEQRERKNISHSDEGI